MIKNELGLDLDYLFVFILGGYVVVVGIFESEDV